VNPASARQSLSDVAPGFFAEEWSGQLVHGADDGDAALYVLLLQTEMLAPDPVNPTPARQSFSDTRATDEEAVKEFVGHVVQATEDEGEDLNVLAPQATTLPPAPV
jgi:hypothetical protein